MPNSENPTIVRAPVPGEPESLLVVERKPPETPVYDVMGGDGRREIKVHDHGLMALVDVMPRFAPVGKTADFAVVQAARVSYGEGTKQVSEDEGLIRYLMRHRHTTPTEMVEFKFHQVMPIFVARQWIRHRMSSTNEYSARYSVVKDRFYLPRAPEIRAQSSANKQVSEGVVGEMDAQSFVENLDLACARAYEDYEKALAAGIGRELARMLLPLNVYCTHVDTPILTHDLQWIRAGDLRPRQTLLGFEEHPDRGRGGGRRLLPSVITDFSIREDDLYRVILSNGEELVCNAEHKWLGCYASSGSRTWLETRQMAKHPGLWRLLKVFNVWKTGASYNWGFLSAAFDGEGFITHTIGNGKSAGFVQKDNPMLARVKEVLVQEGVRWSEYDSGSGTKTLNLLGGLGAVLEFLGRARPPRLLADWLADTNGGIRPVDMPSVVAVEPAGRGEIASFATSSKTYFANGYPCHNTEWYWKIDLHNLFHFLGLRLDKHAQKEIRDYARAMFSLIAPLVPVSAQAFLDYRLNAMTLSALEVEAARTGQLLASTNKRELAEWEDKKKRLGLS